MRAVCEINSLKPRVGPVSNLRWCSGGALQLLAFAGLSLLCAGCFSTGSSVYLSPDGDDQAVGTRQAPFRTLHRAQAAAREITEEMTGDVVVNLAPGDYRLLRIGRREYEANPTCFKGRISSLAILPWALTSEQIQREATRNTTGEFFGK